MKLNHHHTTLPTTDKILLHIRRFLNYLTLSAFIITYEPTTNMVDASGNNKKDKELMLDKIETLNTFKTNYINFDFKKDSVYLS